MSAEPPNYVYSMFAFIGFVLAIIPFPWIIRGSKCNTGICLYMIWTALGCLNSFINSVIWNNDAINRAPIWCDISSRFIIGFSVAIPAASLCICRRLYYIASMKLAGPIDKAEKRRAMIVDLAIGLGIPVLEMVLQYIVQGHRFNIYEEIGCFPATYDTPVAYPLVYCWPIAIGLISAIYCTLTIRTLKRRRSELKQLLSSGSDLNSGYYFRLMGLASIELFLTVPLGSYVLYLNLQELNPWRGWSDTHLRFSYVDQYPSLIWKSSHLAIVEFELGRWSSVMCAFIFFAFFGFTRDARKNYRIAFNTVCKKVEYGTDPDSVRHEVPHIMEFSRQAFRFDTSMDHSGTPLHSVKAIEPYGSTELLPEPLKHISISFVPPSLSPPELALNLAINPRHSADTPGPVRPNVMPVKGRFSS